MPSAQSSIGFSRGLGRLVGAERSRAVPLLLTALVLAYAVWLSFTVPTNVDVSWLLVVCDRLLDGERLHIDLVEVNPPFSIWLYMPFMLLEHWFGGRAELWLTAGVTGLALGSLLATARILLRADPFYSQPRALIALPAALFVVLCLFPGEFGQREHFATIALLPWIGLQCARQRQADFAAGTVAERILAGLGAAAVVMIKPPHFALALVLPSLCLSFSRRSLRPLFVTENFIGATVVAIYVLYVLIFDRVFVTEILPFVGEIYLPLRAGLTDLLLNWPRTVLLLGASAVMAAGGLKRLHWDAAIPLLCAISFVPAFVVMGKGWPNHALPMVVLALLAFGLQILRLDNFVGLTVVRKAAAVFGCVLVLQTTVRVQYAALAADNGPLDRTVAAIRETMPAPTIVSLAARLQVAHPLARLVDGHFVSRYPAAWVADNAEVLRRTTTEPDLQRRLGMIRDDVIGELAQEIASKEPDIVLYSPYPQPHWNNLVLGDPRIAAGLLDYDVLHREPLVTVYVRKGLSRQRSEAETANWAIR